MRRALGLMLHYQIETKLDGWLSEGDLITAGHVFRVKSGLGILRVDYDTAFINHCNFEHFSS